MAFDDLIEAVKSVKTHKRFNLRATAIGAILLGDVLNFASLLAAFISNDGNAPKYLTIWASIVLGCSFLWNCVDLATHSDQIFKSKHVLSLSTLVFFDMLGFLSYLALIIANGIIIGDLWHGPTVLYTYNSVPWITCCGIHGIITLQNLPGMFLNLGNRSTCCAECHHKAKRGATGGDGANRSLLEREQYDEHYQDIERNTPGA